MPISALVLGFVALTSPISNRAGDITVYEDSFGVPSIVAGSTDEAVYAMGFLEAREFAQRMALNYKLARGRLAEALGRGSLLQDGFIRGLGLEDRAADVAAHLSGESKSLVDSFVAGANKALADQQNRLPKWVEPFTDTDAIALVMFIQAAFPLLDLSAHLSPGAGSNQFALAPSHSSTHHPILSMDPHLNWDGGDGGIVWQEFAIYTPAIHFRGVAIPGLPLGVMGHNDRVAWSMTNNDPQLYTIYTVKTNPENGNQYSYHGAWRDFKSRKVDTRYLDNGELKTSSMNLRLTDWGPMIPFSNRAVRLAVPDPIVTLRQGLQMMEAKNGAEFRTALKLRGISMWNYVYADVEGNIGYQYNAAVPKRDPSIDWDRAVAGEDPKTEWGEIWSLDDLPHAENPASGILVNCNSSPKLTTLGGEIAGEWPKYVTSYGPTTRWEMLSALLKAGKRVSPDRAKEIATDCTVPYASQTIDQLARFVDVGNAVDVLKKWDRKATVDSIGCVLYTYWLREGKINAALSSAAGAGQSWTAEQGAEAKSSLEAAAQKMIAEQGSLLARWGGIQFMQRGTVKTPVQGFGYVVPGSGLAAISPASAGANTLKDGRSHATFGSSFRMIVSLDPRGIQSWSVLPYGNSNDPESPHYADQMDLYAVGKYKSTYFGLADAKKHAVKTYNLHN